MTTKVWEALFASRATKFQPSEIREFTKLLNNPNVILLAGGVPDPRLFPVEQLRGIYQDVLGDSPRSRAALQYEQSEGHAPLRQWIAAQMSGRGVLCTSDNVLVVNGSQQALDLLGKVFLDPHDIVGVSSPTYLGALQAFSTYEPQFVTLPTGATASTLIAGHAHQPKLIYAMADFPNPTGICLSLDERKALARLAESCGAVLVEDNAYSELRYDGESIPLLTSVALRGRSIDDGNCVYLGTFSKSVAPGLRLGWMIAPRGLMGKLVIAKQAGDLQASTINQVVLAEFLARHFVDWTQYLRDEYRKRRDTMIAALEDTPLRNCRWARPRGGFFIWVEGPQELDAQVLLRQAITEAGVAFVPGRAFHADGSGRHTFRLSFSHAPLEHLAIGIERLSRLLG